MQVEYFGAKLLDLRPHLRFLAQRRFVCCFQRVFNCLYLRGNLPIDLLDLRADLNHGREGWLEDLELLLILRNQHVASIAQAVDRAVREDLRNVHAVRLFHLAPQLLVPYALRNKLAQCSVGACQIALGNGSLLGDDNNLLALGKFEHFALGFLEAQLELGNLILEKCFGVSVGLKPLVQIGCDIGLSISVCDSLRARRNRVGIA